MAAKLYFDWDPNKAQANLQKHGIEFAEAESVFHDPWAVTEFDEAHSADEER